MLSAISTTIGHPYAAGHQPAPIAPKKHGILASFFIDVLDEFKREVHFDTTGSDRMVENHVNGLIILLFAMIIGILISSYAVLALAFHA